jgi:hypothetical protein
MDRLPGRRARLWQCEANGARSPALRADIGVRKPGGADGSLLARRLARGAHLHEISAVHHRNRTNPKSRPLRGYRARR